MFHRPPFAREAGMLITFKQTKRDITLSSLWNELDEKLESIAAQSEGKGNLTGFWHRTLASRPDTVVDAGRSSAFSFTPGTPPAVLLSPVCSGDEACWLRT